VKVSLFITALVLAALVVGAPIQAQTATGVPDGFVGPRQVSSRSPLVVSAQRWDRGDERLELVQEMPIGTKVPSIALPSMSAPTCSNQPFSVTERSPKGQTTTYRVNMMTFSNVGGSFHISYYRTNGDSLPDDVKAYFAAMCAQWKRENALGVPATPPPTPSIPQPPNGFSGGNFEPSAGSVGLYSARWYRQQGESLYIVSLRHPMAPDPSAEYASIGVPAMFAYHFISNDAVGQCPVSAARIVDYSIGEPSGESYVHALYTAGTAPLFVAYRRRDSNEFPNDVNDYFAALCKTSLAAPPGNVPGLPATQTLPKNALFRAPDGWRAISSSPDAASWANGYGVIEASLTPGEEISTEAELRKALSLGRIPVTFGRIASLPRCGDLEKASWSAHYRVFYTGGNTSDGFTAFRATPLGLMTLTYKHPAGTPEDSKATRSLLSYCP